MASAKLMVSALPPAGAAVRGGVGGPVVAVVAQRDDPLVGVAVAGDGGQPALVPVLRGHGAGRVFLGHLIVQRRDEEIHACRPACSMSYACRSSPTGTCSQSCRPASCSAVGDLGQERREFRPDRRRRCPAQSMSTPPAWISRELTLEVVDESVLRFRRAVREVFHGFGHARVPAKLVIIGSRTSRLLAAMNWSSGTSFSAGKRAVGIRQREPFRADVGELVGVGGQRIEARRVPAHLKPSRICPAGRGGRGGAGRELVG